MLAVIAAYQFQFEFIFEEKRIEMNLRELKPKLRDNLKRHRKWNTMLNFLW